jgi:hypothetical protein
MKLSRAVNAVRRLLRCATVMVLILAAGGLVGVGFPSRPAYGASGTITAGPPGSSGFYQTDYSGLLWLRTAPTALEAGHCLDVWFGGNPRRWPHVDARVARSCHSHTRRDTGITHQATAVTGPLAVRVCYGRDNATNSPITNCTTTTGKPVDPTVPMVANLPNPCTRSWTLTAGGTLTYHPGGSPTSCTS